jgi:putative transposase
MFHTPVRKQVRNGMLSPVAFERQRILKAEGVHKSRGYSVVLFP